MLFMDRLELPPSRSRFILGRPGKYYLDRDSVAVQPGRVASPVGRCCLAWAGRSAGRRGGDRDRGRELNRQPYGRGQTDRLEDRSPGWVGTRIRTGAQSRPAGSSRVRTRPREGLRGPPCAGLGRRPDDRVVDRTFRARDGAGAGRCRPDVAVTAKRPPGRPTSNPFHAVSSPTSIPIERPCMPASSIPAPVPFQRRRLGSAPVVRAFASGPQRKRVYPHGLGMPTAKDTRSAPGDQLGRAPFALPGQSPAGPYDHDGIACERTLKYPAGPVCH